MTLLMIAIKTGLVLLLTALLACAARRKSAALRHLIWMTGLSVSLLLPLAAILVPSWRILPTSKPIELLLVAPPSAASATAPQTATPKAPDILLIWAAGTLLLVGWMVVGRLSLSRWTRRSRPVSSRQWQATIREVIASDQRWDRVRFLEADWIATPATWGTFQPTVLLPTDGGSWAPALRRDALIHELAHLQRLDPVAHLIGRLACAVHWYNPLAWFAARSARLAREQACDDAVLASSATPADYAGLLVQVARARSPLLPEPALGLVQRSVLSTRIRALLDPGRRRGPVRRPLAVAVTLSAIGVMLSLAAVAPAPAQQDSAKAKPGPADSSRVAQKPDSAMIRRAILEVCGKVRKTDSTRAGEQITYTIRIRGNEPDSSKTYTVRVRGC
jgi:bla regulator protein BlaR1